MKFYPKKQYDGSYGFNESEVRTGQLFLSADVKCHDCGKEMPLAVAGSVDNGKCILCGGKTL